MSTTEPGGGGGGRMVALVALVAAAALTFLAVTTLPWIVGSGGSVGYAQLVGLPGFGPGALRATWVAFAFWVPLGIAFLLLILSVAPPPHGRWIAAAGAATVMAAWILLTLREADRGAPVIEEIVVGGVLLGLLVLLVWLGPRRSVGFNTAAACVAGLGLVVHAVVLLSLLTGLGASPGNQAGGAPTEGTAATAPALAPVLVGVVFVMLLAAALLLRAANRRSRERRADVR